MIQITVNNAKVWCKNCGQLLNVVVSDIELSQGEPFMNLKVEPCSYCLAVAEDNGQKRAQDELDKLKGYGFIELTDRVTQAEVELSSDRKTWDEERQRLQEEIKILSFNLLQCKETSK